MTTLDNALPRVNNVLKRNVASDGKSFTADRSSSARPLDLRDVRDAQRRDMQRVIDHGHEIHAKFERALDRVSQELGRSEEHDKLNTPGAGEGSSALNRLVEQSPFVTQPMAASAQAGSTEETETQHAELQCAGVNVAQPMQAQPPGIAVSDVAPPPSAPAPQEPSATLSQLRLRAQEVQDDDRWRFEMVDPRLPISGMHMQRMFGGELRVELKAQARSAGADIERPLQRLRERLAERGVTLLPINRKETPQRDEAGSESDSI